MRPRLRARWPRFLLSWIPPPAWLEAVGGADNPVPKLRPGMIVTVKAKLEPRAEQPSGR